MELERQWVYHEDEEEEEEVGTDLLGRKSRNQNKTNPSVANDSSEYSVLLSESGNGFEVESINKEDVQEVLEEKNGEEEETVEEMQSNEGGIIVDVERDNEERKSVETSTYFDKQAGDKSSSVFSGVEFDSVECSIPETNARCDASEITVNILEAQNSTGVATIHQENKYLDDKIFHDFIFPSSEVSSGMQIFDPKSLGQVEHENGLKKENEREITEFDVEKVLEKQNTHDLYCPNCNSCITRRVILRKRKRRIQDIHFGLKRERPEPIIHPKVEYIPADVTTDQDINVADESLDGNYATATNENNQVREREAFRCLSCFSIFIPTGSGFKLFQCFGDKNDDKNISSERRPARIFDHFFSKFKSDDGKMAKQGNEQQQETNVGASDSSHTLNNALTPQSAQPMTIQEPAVPVQPFGILEVVINGTMPSKEGEEDTVASSTQGPPQLGEVETDLGNKPANAEQNDKSGVTMITDDMQLPYGSDQSLSPFAENAAGKIVQPPQDTTFNFQSDGLKALVPSSELTNEKPQNGVHVEPELVMENATAGSHIHSIQPIKLPEPQKPAKEVRVLENSLSASDQNISVTDQKVPVGLSVPEIITSEDEKGKGTMEASQRAEDSVIPETINVPAAETQIHMGEHAEAREIRGFDILKSIVYGGLLESITSVGIVLSSAGADASTLNIMALGLANLLAGLLLIGHNLKELKNDQTRTTSSEQDEQVDRYQETLGRRENFVLHAVVVVLSFIIFGLVPLVTYGLLFRKSDSYKDYKLLAVFGAAFVCIIVLAVGKAHTQRPPRTPKTYIKTVMYHAALAVSASGISYIVGELIQELLNKLGWFASSASMNMPYLRSEAMKQPLWSSY